MHNIGLNQKWKVGEKTGSKDPPRYIGHSVITDRTILELQCIGMHLLTELYEDRIINVASRVKSAPLLGSNVFQAKVTIFILIQDIIGMNLLTKFHEDWTINVASRLKNALPLGSHAFQANVTIFELIQVIIETNLLTKFHKDWTINVAS
ncbi:hypothetical protein DPMN_004406 [Dreissena polymorpha]|uniref:Uncharacterized protein n=1 Tax=Dreissena polymorpha TaxID=45954 RepID=A0A9D4MMS2_DREPO|nr:hypothetical protein DPMN_004406 [Dreissena polymorpha]